MSAAAESVSVNGCGGFGKQICQGMRKHQSRQRIRKQRIRFANGDMLTSRQNYHASTWCFCMCYDCLCCYLFGFDLLAKPCSWLRQEQGRSGVLLSQTLSTFKTLKRVNRIKRSKRCKFELILSLLRVLLLMKVRYVVWQSFVAHHVFAYVSGCGKRICQRMRRIR